MARGKKVSLLRKRERGSQLCGPSSEEKALEKLGLGCRKILVQKLAGRTKFMKKRHDLLTSDPR